MDETQQISWSKKMRFLLLPSMILPLLFQSCASNYQDPDIFRERIRSYKSQKTTRISGLDIPTFAMTYREVKGGPSRNIASVPEAAPAQKKTSAKPSEVGHLSDQSNKRLYFLSLYDQYRRLSTYLEEEIPDIKICPQFHSSFKQNFDFQFYKKRPQPELISQRPLPIPQEGEVFLYPEYALSLSAEKARPNLLDIMSKEDKKDQMKAEDLREQFVKAYKLHLEKIYHELGDLCENGQSDNYFIFENLITHVKNHQEFNETDESLKALLKTLPMSNMLLLYSLELNQNSDKGSDFQEKITANKGMPKGRGLASVQENHFEKEVIQRLSAEWSLKYFQELKKRRQKN